MPSEITRRGLLLVLSSPSGAGKTTITRRLIERDPGLAISVSVAARPPRAGEIDGKHYRFIDAAAFDRMVASGELKGMALDGNVLSRAKKPTEESATDYWGMPAGAASAATRAKK